MGDLFYPLGIGLTILAVLVSFWGLRNKDFPSSRGLLMGGIAIFAVLVVATAVTAWSNAELEQDHRENEEAEHAAEEAELEHEAEQSEEAGQPGGGAAGAELEEEEATQGGGTQGTEGQSGATLDLTSPEDGSLVFDPESLEAAAGSVTVSYTNPASVPHNVHIEREGEDLAASEDVSDGDSTEATADLEAGEYTYYCSIPGHREGGMEGTLTVD
jgi:plastocyanin